jgi:hypothetical protein
LELFNLLTGIPQGSPLSPILFLFFNADLIDDIQAAFPGKVLVTAYIDDLSVMVWGNSTIQNCRRLERIHGVAEHWESTHASRFAPPKYGLIHLWKKRPGIPKPLGLLEAVVTIHGVEVKPTLTLKYLGVMLDTGLAGTVHVN